MTVDLLPIVSSSMRLCLASISMRHLLLVAALGLAACADPAEIAEEREERETDIAQDVELVGCQPQANGWMAAQVRVTNRSSERSNYFVEVAFTSEDKAQQYDTSSATVNALAPDQAADDQVTSFSEPPGPYLCEVVDVTRYSDE